MMRWLFMLALATGALPAAEGIAIHLREEVEVLRGRALLSDVAELAGDPILVRDLEGVVIQQCPDGNERLIDAERIRATLSGLVPMRLVTVRGTCQLRRAVESISSADLNALVLDELVRRSGIGAEVTLTREANAVVVPVDIETPWTAVVESLVANTVGEVPVRIRIRRGEAEIGRSLAVARIRQVAVVMVPTRDLRRGEILTQADLRPEQVDLASGRFEMAGADELVGLQIRRDCPADAPLPAGVLVRPPAVRGGQQIELSVASGDFIVTTLATALADGAIGEDIQVRRSTDGRSMLARVVGSGAVEVVAVGR